MTSGWPGPEVAELAEWIRKRTGLTFPPGRMEPAAGSLVAALANDAGIDATIERLTRNPAALDQLIAELTIGETYFFRHPEQFQVLRDLVLPQFRERRNARVRAWSAGCATGEEPYSLAILLHEEGITADRVVGTDISRARLTAARRGRYRKWSFRGVPGHIIDRYFQASAGWYQLSAGVRAEVDFRYLNLVEDRYPSATAGIWGMDIIFCRNVLIYLDRTSIARVARRLVDSLSDEGWLLLGASDPSIVDLAPVDVIVTDAGLAYRRKSGSGEGTTFSLPATRRPPLAVGPPEPVESQVAPPQVKPPEPEPPVEERPRRAPAPSEAASTADERAPLQDEGVSDAEELNRLYWEQRYPEVAEGARKLIAEDRATEEVDVLLVRSLANQGRTTEAGQAVLEGLERHAESAELHCLHAILLLGRGQAREALTAARRALYLQPDLVLAHLTYADAAVQLRKLEDGARALRNAERLLSGIPADDVVPASDGETAGRLLRIAQFRFRRIAAQGSGS